MSARADTAYSYLITFCRMCRLTQSMAPTRTNSSIAIAPFFHSVSFVRKLIVCDDYLKYDREDELGDSLVVSTFLWKKLIN